MIKHNSKNNVLNTSNILSKTNALAIFSHYTSGFVKLNQLFRSSLRTDKFPTCSIAYINGRLLYTDFADVSGIDCFGYVMLKFKISFGECGHI